MSSFSCHSFFTQFFIHPPGIAGTLPRDYLRQTITVTVTLSISLLLWRMQMLWLEGDRYGNTAKHGIERLLQWRDRQRWSWWLTMDACKHTQSHVGTHTHNYLIHALQILCWNSNFLCNSSFLKRRRSGSDCNLMFPPCRGSVYSVYILLKNHYLIIDLKYLQHCFFPLLMRFITHLPQLGDQGPPLTVTALKL